MRSRLLQVCAWPVQRWLAAAAGTLVAAILIGVPTVMVVNPWFTRMTPTVWWEHPIWLVSSVLAGLVSATFVRVGAAPELPTTEVGKAASGGLLSALAVGCPVCNKVVVTLVGASGAMQLWAPVQPVLGVASVALLAVALGRRLDAEARCALPRGEPTRTPRSFVDLAPQDHTRAAPSLSTRTAEDA